jgi:receptor protein-tyrosine kinase
MEFWQAYSVVRRRWWLILGLIGLATLVALVSVLVQRPVYRATTTINTGAGLTAEYYTTGVQLADMQAVLTSQFLLTKLNDQLKLDKTYEEIEKAIRVSRVGESGVLRIDVLWEDPFTAAGAANALADSFLDYQNGQLKVQAQREVSQLEGEVKLAKERLDRAQASLPPGASTSNEPAARAAEEELIAARQNYGNAINRLESARSIASSPASASAASVIDRAVVPPKAESNNLVRTLVFGALFGAFLGISVSVGAEYLNPSFRLLDAIENKIGVPILAVIPWERHFGARFYPTLDKMSESRREAFRLLRSNLLTSRRPVGQNVGADGHARRQFAPITALVVSERSGAGTSSVVANLGSALAYAGHRVLLVDANLLEPSLDQFVHLRSDRSFNQWLENPSHPLEAYIQPTSLPNLHLLASSRGHPFASDWLARFDLNGLLQSLSRSYDVILVDSPPLDRSSDPRLWSAAVGGVIVVIRPRGNKDEDRARRAIEFAGDRLLGVVINGLDIESSLATGRLARHAHTGQTGIFQAVQVPGTAQRPPNAQQAGMVRLPAPVAPPVAPAPAPRPAVAPVVPAQPARPAAPPVVPAGARPAPAHPPRPAAQRVVGRVAEPPAVLVQQFRSAPAEQRPARAPAQIPAADRNGRAG